MIRAIYIIDLLKLKVRLKYQILLEMFNPKRLLCLGLALGSVLCSYDSYGSQRKWDKDMHDKDLDDLLETVEDENPFCARWHDDLCLECAARSYLNQKKICVQMDPLCRTFDMKSKRCVDCYPGFQINGGKCVVENSKVEENWVLSNPLCASWQNKKCIKCSSKSYFNQERICIMISPDCKTFSQSNGFCLSCFDGFQLDKNGRCLKTTQNDWKKRDPLCSKWDWNGKCIQCAPRSYRNPQGLCQQVDPNCNTFSSETGECFSCYKGFGVKNRKCIQEASSTATANPYCAKWEGSKCQKCSARTFLNSKTGICAPVNQLCRTFSEGTGDCTTCYPGYKLSDGKCVLGSNFNPNSNPLCGKWLNQKCVQCSARSYFNREGLCVGVDPNCATFNDKSGACLSCYPGYEIQKDKCAVKNVGPSQQSLTRNRLCGQWTGQKCSKCSHRSYFDEQGICTQIDPYCQKFSQEKRICMKCYNGYKLKKNLKNCVLPVTVQSTTQKPQVSPANEEKNFGEITNGSSFDLEKCMIWKQGRCLECAKNLIVNSAGACVCK